MTYWGISQLLKFVPLVDETNIFCTGENMQQILSTITTENKQDKTLVLYKLSLNLSKTKFKMLGRN